MGNEIADDHQADDGAQRARHELNELVRVVGDDVLALSDSAFGTTGNGWFVTPGVPSKCRMPKRAAARARRRPPARPLKRAAEQRRPGVDPIGRVGPVRPGKLRLRGRAPPCTRRHDHPAWSSHHEGLG